MPVFRKKPVLVTAMEVLDNPSDEYVNAMHEFLAHCDWNSERDGISIETNAGTMSASTGDWIIRGVKGEFYPCKPDIFAATYDGPLQAEAPAPGLYAPERMPPRDEYGMCCHPDLPACEEEEPIAPLLLAQGFESVAIPGDGDAFPEEALEQGGDAYWAAMRAWHPTAPEGSGWLLAAVFVHEDGPFALFVRSLAMAGRRELDA